jgi:PTH1 family peptidyl-tRNA hydrolase
MFLVVGLGNPGKEYENARHNVGYRVIQSLAEALGISLGAVGCRARVGKGEKNSSPIVLAQPLTFVNSSGESVKGLIDNYDIPLENLVVIHDDLDLPLGTIRLKMKGSSGGHKGVDSIIYHLESDEFGRVRIGIGRPPGRQDPADFVLSDFTQQEKEEISVAVQEGADAVICIIKEGFQTAMNKYNRSQESKVNRPPEAG